MFLALTAAFQNLLCENVIKMGLSERAAYEKFDAKKGEFNRNITINRNAN